MSFGLIGTCLYGSESHVLYKYNYSCVVTSEPVTAEIMINYYLSIYIVLCFLVVVVGGGGKDCPVG